MKNFMGNSSLNQLMILGSLSTNLTQTNSYGNIPSSFRNLTQLTVLMLNGSKLTSQISSRIGNHNPLTALYLGENKLHGLIPESVHRLQTLEELDLGFKHNATIPQLKLEVSASSGCNLEISKGDNLGKNSATLCVLHSLVHSTSYSGIHRNKTMKKTSTGAKVYKKTTLFNFSTGARQDDGLD
uniref:Leucine-rich repeat-containing N-terminal plant-type domain-containing protein n=1 Tax=Salix viminalis TaxID=40686 RepID=A0A6N2KLJ9_SALVM